MIKADARLRIEKIPIACLQVKEYQEQHMSQLEVYVQKLKEHPGEYAGLISVVPSDTHPGMFCVLDGHHRYAASILTGRPDALCLVVEEPA